MIDLMKIKINEPNELENYDALKYARDWIADKHFKIDDPKFQTKKVNNLKHSSEMKHKFFTYAKFFVNYVAINVIQVHIVPANE